MLSFSQFITEKRSKKERYANIAKKMEKFIGNDYQFHRNLKRIGKLKAADVKGIAKPFAHTHSSDGKAKSLRKMTGRHNSLKTFQAASRATAGRIAA